MGIADPNIHLAQSSQVGHLPRVAIPLSDAEVLTRSGHTRVISSHLHRIENHVRPMKLDERVEKHQELAL